MDGTIEYTSTQIDNKLESKQKIYYLNDYKNVNSQYVINNFWSKYGSNVSRRNTVKIEIATWIMNQYGAWIITRNNTDTMAFVRTIYKGDNVGFNISYNIDTDTLTITFGNTPYDIDILISPLFYIN